MAEVIKGILPSRLMRREVPYNAVLPEGYATAKKRFPVLYLLHGLFGSCDNWIELTGLQSYADQHELVVITPEGADSWYVDSTSDKRRRFESYILRELIPRVDDVLRTRAHRESRGVAGNSMGGYGALRFALKRPDLFSFAASTSGAFHAPALLNTTDEQWRELMPSIEKAFGPTGTRARRLNDIFQIAAVAQKKGSLPVISIDCGNDDSFLEVNRDLSRKLTDYGIIHRYKEFSGGHDWDYWDNRVKEIMKQADEILS